MSTTVARVVSARRSRLARIDEGIAADEEKLEAARQKLGELAEAEDAAVAEAKRRNPLANPYKLREPAQELRAEREKLERSLAGIEKGLAVLRSDRVAAGAEQAARELGERTEEARDLVAKEREARIAAGKAFASLVERWNALADVLSKRSEFLATVAGEQFLDRVGIFDREAIAAWEQVAPFVVEPVPTTLASFLEEALEATTGGRPEDEDPEVLRGVNAHRATLGLAAERHVVSPLARELAAAYPDLRSEVREADVTGATIRRPRNSEPAWTGEAA